MDPITYVFESPFILGRIAKWQVIVSQCDIVYMTRKAVKGSMIADLLAENPIKDYEALDFKFSDKYINAVGDDVEGIDDMCEMYFDRVVNLSDNGIGIVLVAPDGKHFSITVKLRFGCTNNVAKYEACMSGLQTAIEMMMRKLEVHGDSAPIIYQVKGEWQTKDPKLILYKKYLLKLIKEFEEISFTHLCRDKNQFTDALATLAVMTQMEEGQIMQEYPPRVSRNKRRMIRRLALGYFPSGKILYKRTSNGELLRCTNAKEVRRILFETHEGNCATHSNGYMMAKQILRRDYFWTTLEKDCIEHFRKYHKWQIYANKINVPPYQLYNLVSPWPFAMCGIEVICLINLKASNGHRFILVAIDYFTKWVEAISYAHITQNTFLKFFKNNIICRYGLPGEIVTDKANNLNGPKIQKLCAQYKI
ncbi:uncharacterized protein LOC131178346 [Hevea brasiliensis]|uniref:uncharacterized protein LOC131178346 n=1 Tax=Hevea brasiliensis TaxID=3981 RepID=UPI0025E272E3|nr:uncharacterized protein LOC131178346 [Hevea brasiliensis]